MPQPANPSKNAPARRVAIVIELDYALPWHQDCYQGIMQYSREKNWRSVLDLTVTGMHGDATRTDYDGVVGRIPPRVMQWVEGLGLPMVNLIPYEKPENAELLKRQYGVFADPPACARMAVEHLAQNGYPRIGMVMEQGHGYERIAEAVASACAAHGVGCVEPFICPEEVPRSFDGQFTVVRDLGQYLEARAKPVGLIVNPDFYARHGAHICLELDIRVPEDVGLLALSAAPITLTSGWPTISSIECDYFKQGYEAAAMLDRLMAGERVHPMRRTLPPVEVAVRDSTDVFLCEDELVSKAMKYITKHLRQDISVQQLAEAMGVSPPTLHRRFEQSMGRSPMQEINRVRLDYIKRLLSETDKPIAKVGKDCGFSTASHFTRFFKREVGVTPSAYRAERKNA